MPSISQHYDYAGPPPFVDVDTQRDTRIFLDPARIRWASAPHPWHLLAVEQLETFFDEVSTATLQGVHQRARALLEQFPEPELTHLGLSTAGFHGRGAGAIRSGRIHEALEGDLRALLEVGLLTRLEQLPLFVEGVGADVTSDVATVLIFPALAGFTWDIASTCESMRLSFRLYEQRVWLPSEREWGVGRFELPTLNGEPLLLVPSRWAGPRHLLNHSGFYGNVILEDMVNQGSPAAFSRGMWVPPTKKILRAERQGPVKEVNLQQTLQAHGVDANLVDLYTRRVRMKHLQQQRSAA